jgi:hypothetical protein
MEQAGVFTKVTMGCPTARSTGNRCQMSDTTSSGSERPDSADEVAGSPITILL